MVEPQHMTGRLRLPLAYASCYDEQTQTSREQEGNYAA
jgi:hypothetical protein